MKRLVFATAVALATLAHAEEAKVLLPDQANARICPAGQALTWTIACDPGTRFAVDRIWNLGKPGVEICRARSLGCVPIPDQWVATRPGFEVQDSPAAGELVSVTWGLARLLGEKP